MKLQLSLRDLFWLVLVAACLCSWWLDRTRLIDAHSDQVEKLQQEMLLWQTTW
jgi:hypothetical protein